MESWQGKWLKVRILYSRPGIAQQIWLNNEKGAILVDTGDGVVRDIISNRLPISQLKGIVITHGHFDHVGGLHSLLGFLRCTGKKGLLPIYAEFALLHTTWQLLRPLMICIPFLQHLPQIS